MNDNEKDKDITEEVLGQVSEQLKNYNDLNFLEQYAIYMMRIQMYEQQLKNDLVNLFDVDEIHAERMNLSSIYRHIVNKDIRAHPILYRNIQDIAKQRNIMAHEFLLNELILNELIGKGATDMQQRAMDKWLYELELAYQQYYKLKELDNLYKDWGVKPELDE